MKNTKKIRKSKNKNSARNTILILALIFVVCLAWIIIYTVTDKTISSDKALEIALTDLGITSQEAGSPHIHEETYEGQPCYNIYLTVNGKSLTYVISTKGEILHKGEGSHSH